MVHAFMCICNRKLSAGFIPILRSVSPQGTAVRGHEQCSGVEWWMKKDKAMPLV